MYVGSEDFKRSVGYTFYFNGWDYVVDVLPLQRCNQPEISVYMRFDHLCFGRSEIHKNGKKLKW